MMKNCNGYIHSVETAATVDGPGIRRVLFLTGCPLNCLYCHNPDTRKKSNGKLTDAYTELRAIAKNQTLLQSMNGGVTLSGGEPLCQPEFVKTIFEGCKRMGIHTALDTSGYLGDKADDELLSNTDLVLLDIKSMNPTTYKALAGVDLEATLTFAKRLAEKKIPVWLRHVLIPGYTDDLTALNELASFAHSLGNVERVEILPFHKMGEYKWKQLGLDYQLFNTPEPSFDLINMAKSPFVNAGLQVF